MSKDLTSDQQAFKGRVEEWKAAEGVKCSTLEEWKANLAKWLYLEPQDSDVLDVTLAALLDREIPGDPVWLYLIAPPGGFKTELLRSFRTYPKAYTLDTLTSSTFVSGLAEKNKDSGEMEPVAGILRDLDGRVVIVKDLTTLMNSNEDNRNEIYGQLRSIYDGYYEKAFGSMRRKVSVTATIGLVCGVTPIIDKYSAMHSTLGERFLKIRSDPDKWQAATRALDNEGHERLMRQELANGTRTFLEALSFSRVPELTEDQTQEVLRMAMYVAFMRANVWSRYSEGQVVDLEVITSEVPTRIAKQLKHLAKILAVIRGHPDHISDADMDTLARVARDTAEIKKQAIMGHYMRWGIDGDYDPNDMANPSTSLFRVNARNHCNILASLGCMVMGTRGYKLAESFKPYLRAAFRGYTPLPSPALQKEPENGLSSKRAGGKGIYGSLQERLDAIHGHLQHAVIDPMTNEVAEELGFEVDEALKLLRVLEKDGRVFQPRPGYWRVS